ncbi:TPR repeat region-containing protein [Nocardiopsis dassonvillei]|uniref:TPR repeat region-containing protein n=1 Tax=Nocardiopsis dassonvillei TaxID=2014 RepID=UPI003636FE45
MATFSVIFVPRDFYYDSKPVYDCAADLEVLNARLLGRADDLSGSFDSAAGEFTDVIAWDIRSLSEEDLQNWRDAAVSVTYAASVAEMWADAVKAFHDEREAQITSWEGSRTEKENAVPSKYQDDHITSSHPQADGFLWTDWGAGDEARCRALYDELVTVQEGLISREQTNWQGLQDSAEEIRTMLEQGPTPENVRKLMNAGNANWAFLNLDPSRYSSLIDDSELTPENAEQYADELAAYWSGDKPLDDRYHEMMLVLTMVGTGARQNQQDGTPLSPEEIAFLEEFYAQLEEPYRRDGVGAGIMVYPDLMAESDMSDEEREDALGVLGNGLLALSDPALGGGYDNLPESFRYAVEGSWINPDAENKLPGTPVSMGMDMKALSAFMEHTDEGLQGGYGLSTNLHLTTGAFLDAWGDDPDPDGVLPDSEQVSHIIDVASRNTDANYYMLTGEHINTEEGVDHGDEDLRTRALEGTLTHEWHDDGLTARQLTDWLAEDIHSEDPDVRQRAGDGFAGFMETITKAEMHEALVNTGVDVTEGDNEYSDASFTQFNGELADSLADVFDAHIYSFANTDILDLNENPVTGIGDFDPETGTVRLGAEERALYMQLLVGNDETAGRMVNTVDVYKQLESIAFLESGNEATAARGAGQLQGLLERALYLDSEDRSADLDKTIERNTQIAEFVVGEAGSLSESVPVIGKALSMGMGLAEESIVNAIVDGEYEVSPRHPVYTGEESTTRAFQAATFDFLAHSDPGAFDGVERGHLRALVDGGALTIEQNGVALDAADIPNDFVIDDSVTMSFETDPNRWRNNEDDALSGMDDALSAVMDGTTVDITYEDEYGYTVDHSTPAHEGVEQFTDQYMGGYREAESYFGGGLETFGNPPEDS